MFNIKMTDIEITPPEIVIQESEEKKTIDSLLAEAENNYKLNPEKAMLSIIEAATKMVQDVNPGSVLSLGVTIWSLIQQLRFMSVTDAKKVAKILVSKLSKLITGVIDNDTAKMAAKMLIQTQVMPTLYSQIDAMYGIHSANPKGCCTLL